MEVDSRLSIVGTFEAILKKATQDDVLLFSVPGSIHNKLFPDKFIVSKKDSHFLTFE